MLKKKTQIRFALDDSLGSLRLYLIVDEFNSNYFIEISYWYIIPIYILGYNNDYDQNRINPIHYNDLILAKYDLINKYFQNN